MDFDSGKKFALEISCFIFYLYELYSFFHYPQEISLYDGSFEIFHLRLIMLLLALPLLYIYRVAYFFDLERVLFKEENAFMHLKLFYYAIYIILFSLLLLKIGGYVYKFFRQIFI